MAGEFGREKPGVSVESQFRRGRVRTAPQEDRGGAELPASYQHPAESQPQSQSHASASAQPQHHSQLRAVPAHLRTPLAIPPSESSRW